MNVRGGFWFCTYKGVLNGELFVTLLRKMMQRRTKPVETRTSWARVNEGYEAATEAFVFRGAQYDRGLAWVWFPEGFGGLGAGGPSLAAGEEEAEQAFHGKLDPGNESASAPSGNW